MGEIAEMMLEGTLCECCGSYIEGNAPGFPRYCSDQCARDRGAEPAPSGRRKKGGDREGQSSLPRFNRYSIPPRAGTVDCPYCAAHPKLNGLADHIAAKHPEKIKGDAE